MGKSKKTRAPAPPRSRKAEVYQCPYCHELGSVRIRRQKDPMSGANQFHVECTHCSTNSYKHNAGLLDTPVDAYNSWKLIAHRWQNNRIMCPTEACSLYAMIQPCASEKEGVEDVRVVCPKCGEMKFSSGNQPFEEFRKYLENLKHKRHDLEDQDRYEKNLIAEDSNSQTEESMPGASDMYGTGTNGAPLHLQSESEDDI